MAKVTVEADTIEGTMTVKINGEVLQDCRYVEFYDLQPETYGGNKKYEFRASQYYTDENKDVKKYITVCAKDSEAGKKAIQNGAIEHETLKSLVVKDGKSKAQHDIINFFQK